MACEGHHTDGTSVQRSAPSGLKNFPSTNWGSKVAVPGDGHPQPRRSALSSLRARGLRAMDPAFPWSAEVPTMPGGVRASHPPATHPRGQKASSSFSQRRYIQ